VPRGAAIDVVVVGGGIVGVSVATDLAEAGVRVMLVERESVGAGASGRNSGVIQHPSDPALVPLYRETLERYRRLAAVDDAFVLPQTPSGLLHVTRDRDDARALTTAITAAQPELRPQFLDAGQARTLEPALAPDVAACRVEMGFPVGPADASAATARQAERAGAVTRLGDQAAIDVHAGVVTGIRVDGERVPAGVVIVTAGPWTPSVVDPSGAWRPIERLWGVVAEIALPEPPTHVLEEIEVESQIQQGGSGHDAAGEEAGMAFSLVTAAGRSSLGSTFLAREPAPEAFVERLRRRGARFVPSIGDARVVGLRSCARPQSFDGRPLVGAVPWIAGLYVAAGHGAWGISTGPATARLVADLVVGRVASVPPELDVARYGSPRTARALSPPPATARGTRPQRPSPPGSRPPAVGSPPRPAPAVPSRPRRAGTGR
jgi:glycine/D-amino acid oxidase-like deaminating enzyme